MKKRLSVILAFNILIHLFVLNICASATSINDRILSTEAISIGNTYTVSTSYRIMTNVVTQIGSKTVFYGMGSGRLIAYDVTDPENVDLIQELTVTTSEAEMYVKDGCLFFVAGNTLKKCKLNNDGSFGDVSDIDSLGGTPKAVSMKLVDNKIFVAYNEIQVFDISDVENVIDMGNLISVTPKSLAVEQVDDNTYYVYAYIGEAVGTDKGMFLSIYKIVNNMGVMTAECIVSKFDTGLRSTTTDGIVDVVATNTVMTSFGSDQGTNDAAIIDVTNPEEPQIINTVTDTKRINRRIRIDKVKSVCVPRITGSAVKIIDYSEPTMPENLATVNDIRGEGASIFNGILYVSYDQNIKIVKLYDQYVLGEFNVEQTEGEINTNVSIDNYGDTDMNLAIVSAIYKDMSLVDVLVEPISISAYQTGYTANSSIDVSGKTDYTAKVWMIDNMKDMNILTDIEER